MSAPDLTELRARIGAFTTGLLLFDETEKGKVAAAFNELAGILFELTEVPPPEPPAPVDLKPIEKRLAALEKPPAPKPVKAAKEVTVVPPPLHPVTMPGDVAARLHKLAIIGAETLSKQSDAIPPGKVRESFDAQVQPLIDAGLELERLLGGVPA